jgi:SAM-dependent methyltransferase
MLERLTKRLSLGIKKLFFPSEIDQYLKSGRIPWSPGYKQYRYTTLKDIPTNQTVLDLFAKGDPLPQGYGFGLDERIVEYPWLLSRLSPEEGLVLDGGSALNYPFLLDSAQFSNKRLVILTLAPESTMTKRSNISYMFGDLRETLFRDGAFDLIVSISTLEHVGMDNARLYTQDKHYKESRADDYLKVIKEFHRILKPGGRFLLTVPFGKAQNLGWLHQFDSQRLQKAISAFGSPCTGLTFFKYSYEGWERSNEQACMDCEYFDVHSVSEPAADRAAAARAIACMEFVKNA